MKLTRIIFTYSWIYDYNWKRWSKSYKWVYGEGKSTKDVLKAVKMYNRVWKKYCYKIMSSVSDISGLRWRKDYIYCYMVGKCIPFSEPLTIPAYNDSDDFISTLTHELIHQLEVQNLDRIGKTYDYLRKKYKVSDTTLYHIFLNSVHARLILKLFGEKYLKEEIDSYTDKEYIRAWNIAKEEGYDNIINEFRKRID